MSWYIHKLLSDEDQIRSQVILDTTCYFNVVGLPDSSIECQFDTDLYSDLLTVEAKIKQLKDNGLISKNDLIALDCIKLNKSYLELEKLYRVDEEAILSWVKSFLSKLAFHLGSYFTDEGYLNMLKEKYKLSDEEILAVKTYIEGNYKLKRGNINVEK